MKKYIFQLNHLGSKSEKTSGIHMVLLSLFSFSLIYSEIAGSHLSFGFGLIPIEVSLQFSFWEQRYG